jgi:hypothetical protein
LGEGELGARRSGRVVFGVPQFYVARHYEDANRDGHRECVGDADRAGVGADERLAVERVGVL